MINGQRYFINKPVALIGFMGAGKTSVAKLLEEHTGIPSFDTDKEVVKQTQKTVSEIINNEGEESFRKIEAKIFSEIVEDNRSIVATGGGIVESALSRGSLKKCYVVWLKVNARDAAKRIGDFSSRPMFKDVENASSLLIKRDELYKQYSDCEIDTTNKPLNVVVKEVLDILVKEEVLHL